MNFTAKQIADQINGTIVGDPDVNILAISKIEEGSKGSLTFLANPKYTEYIYSTNASATAISRDAPVIILLHAIATRIWPMV